MGYLVFKYELIPGLILQRYIYLIYRRCHIDPSHFETALKRALPPWARYYGGHGHFCGEDIYIIAVDLGTTAIDLENWIEAFYVPGISQSNFTVVIPHFSHLAHRVKYSTQLIQAFIESMSNYTFGQKILLDDIELGEGSNWTVGVNEGFQNWTRQRLQPCRNLKSILPYTIAWSRVVEKWWGMDGDEEIRFEDCVRGYCGHRRDVYRAKL